MAETTRGVIDCGPKPQTQKDARRCPCCGGWPKRAQMVTDRYGWSWSLHTCHACEVQYQARPMTDAARRDFYASGRYRRLCAQVLGVPWDDPVYLKRQQDAYAWRWREHDLRLGAGHWLDYGGSTGVVSHVLAQAMPDSYQPSRVTVADYGDGATTTPEQALAVTDDTYDAIICAQTLDHLAAPLITLESFRRVAKPGARLFCDVVQAEHTALKIDHDCYFPSATSFLSLIERAGWRLVWLDAETNPTHYSVLAETPTCDDTP